MSNPITTEQKPTRWKMRLYYENTWPAYSFTIQDGQRNPRDLSAAQVRLDLKDKNGVTVKSFTVGSGFTIGGVGNSKVSFNPVVIDLAPNTIPYTGDIVITYSNAQVKSYFTVELIVANKK